VLQITSRCKTHRSLVSDRAVKWRPVHPGLGKTDSNELRLHPKGTGGVRHSAGGSILRMEMGEVLFMGEYGERQGAGGADRRPDFRQRLGVGRREQTQEAA
jgi:hypothetical protein